MLGMLFYLLLIILTVTVVVRLGPHYMEYLTVRSVLNDLQDETSSVKGGTRGVKKAVDNRLYINEVRRVDDDAFKYKKTEKGVLVILDYEAREPLFGNVDIVLKFRHEAVIGSR